MMLKTSNSKSTKPRKDEVRLDNNKKEHGDSIKPIGKHKVGGNKVGSNEIGSNEFDNKIRKNQKMSKSKKLSKSKKMIGSSDFFTPGAKLAFTKLR